MEEIITKQDLKELSFTNKKLQTATNSINKINTNIKKNFLKIALILTSIKEEDFEQDGYKDVKDYAGKVFGYKKTQTCNLIRIGEEYTIKESGMTNLPHKDEENDYTVGQVIKMLPLGHEKAVELCDNEVITPEMSCREIEKVVKEHMPEKPVKENEQDNIDNEQDNTENEQEKSIDMLLEESLKYIAIDNNTETATILASNYQNEIHVDILELSIYLKTTHGIVTIEFFNDIQS